ncbi:DUF4190 domain-containing protein [Salinibacterium sp. UTAS2018]|uniref:DUF4190 domain-containing protein n=1 Tax=Salinibacterium sp. UTAS2018 TaxID=2508880 RepID=UPI00100975B0|nr:DUF4190 domain-containing protein [Salinibacterium sp. UTAS2018]QAV70203.1 DUF4190 domain-containing protein [Salinibacterium sp. UTAS2018]
MSEPTPYAAAPVGAPVAKWNVLSIVSLVTSVIGLSLVGIITGHIGMSQIKKTGEQGKVLAIIGLILGYLGFVVALILGIVFVIALSLDGVSSY